MREQSYNEQYYRSIAPASKASARLMIPIVYSFIQPQSVVDVGCGVGAWLHVWQQNGVDDYLGIDGNYAQSHLCIPSKKFFAANLEEQIECNRKFDLAISLEVAEHILPEHAAIFIESLCALADVILFSAAIPGQGGVLHHNEQYPQYWADLFARNGFTGYDCLRERIWMNDQIDACYRQNIFFFVKDSVKEKYPAITSHTGPLMPLVHPQHFEAKEEALQSYKKVLRSPFHAGWYFLKKTFHFFKKIKKDGQ
jgi:SAM-dependent methyltransferase